ncbi:delta1-piperideine-2-carboxylate reductase [Stella humosa]|uniref:Delta1-piperideine-2-carboxylate reductase n=1 Tax=Stella humosa TaxID=94 RepID=A0A3N1KPV5_9PROT|nr:Ldh family oxidoreductase [Stella humosa]ROP80819.1 delta1-piperideine-2-carboxylate reductase [Stella humosa]BBK33390.1 lactate dehydrogenase [Stella humosa]
MSIVLTVAELTDLVAEVLVRHGLARDSARCVAGVVAAAERDGSRSHGLFRLPGYVATLKSGWIDGNARPVVTEVAPGVVAVDAANGFAQPALAAGSPLLIAKARSQGIAAMAIRNSHHFAALWPDVEPFAEAGFVALACVNARSRVAPWGATRKFLGTNPMAFACPRDGAPPLVWDQASSVIAQGEVLLAARDGHDLPDGVGLDAAGQATNDPRAVLDGGAMLPFGGHKGSGIAFMVEILAAAVTGGRFGFEDGSAAFPGAQTSNAGECVILIDPARAGGTDVGSRIAGLFEGFAAAGVSRLPGDARYARRSRSIAEGVSIPAETYETVQRLLAG